MSSLLSLHRQWNELSPMVSQGRPLAFMLVVHPGFIQLSCLWSFFSCALYFSSFYPTVTNADLVLVLRVFFFILILASLSTVIDLIRNRVIPTAFGTQHIAILLVAWCPAIVFGPSPSIPRLNIESSSMSLRVSSWCPQSGLTSALPRLVHSS